MKKQWMILSLSLLMLTGCIQQSIPEYRAVQPLPKAHPKPPAPQTPPKATHTLKEVEDTNFSPEYMYPETAVKKPAKTQQASTAQMTVQMSRDECIGMIGQEKFDHYTQMLGSESGAIKRCIMLKSMR